MALGTTPSLTEINTEIGTTGQSLVTCISNAGKTGTWDRQSDFASYSHGTITVTPVAILIDWNEVEVEATISASSAWQVRSGYPTWISSISPSSGTGTSSLIEPDNNDSGDSRVATIIYELQSNTNVSDSIVITQATS